MVQVEKNEVFMSVNAEECDKFRGNAKHLIEKVYAKTKFVFAKPGSLIKNGDIIIGKAIERQFSDKHPRKTDDKKYVNISTYYEHAWPATVGDVMLGTTGEGYPFIRISLYQRREPVIGDKFAARHGQKGCLANIVNPEDAPFDSRGEHPDIYMNSLALPSRMTIAMLIEIISGNIVISTSALHNITLEDLGLCTKVLGSLDPDDTADVNDAKMDASAKKTKSATPKTIPFSEEFKEQYISKNYGSRMIDATPFRKHDIHVLRSEMKKYGYDCGDEYLTDGETGRMLRALVFFGPAYYQRLKHMVIDKVHARARGPKTILTRQPAAGRSLLGGLRFGQMERDCMLGQGATRFSKDRLKDQSDETKVPLCVNCGLAAVDTCNICGSTTNVVSLPYGTKLVLDELRVMNIVGRIFAK
jgi:DNA-directed RNA polymerase beta subunit